jgi:Flp pilus assembly pilin Flp
MRNLLAKLWKEEEGQDLTEYALFLATAINGTFTKAAGNLTT